jgi:hypothetical protein
VAVGRVSGKISLLNGHTGQDCGEIGPASTSGSQDDDRWSTCQAANFAVQRIPSRKLSLLCMHAQEHVQPAFPEAGGRGIRAAPAAVLHMRRPGADP